MTACHRPHRSPGARRRLGRLGTLLLAAGALLGARQADPPSAEEPLPFSVGERFVYRVRVGKMGTIGSGEMKVEGPATVRGRAAMLLRFDFSSRVGPVRVEDRTRSWLDPARMASLRFEKSERHPLSTKEQDVEIFPGERRWRDADGKSGTTPTDAPLDELSFLYFIRTLPLEPGADHAFDRFYEAGRNPVAVRVLGRETISSPAGEFATVVVEMRVKDPERYGGHGTIRLYLSDDARRLPVRIESAVPVFGTMVLTLESHTHPASPRPASR